MSEKTLGAIVAEGVAAVAAARREANAAVAAWAAAEGIDAECELAEVDDGAVEVRLLFAAAPPTPAAIDERNRAMDRAADMLRRAGGEDVFCRKGADRWWPRPHARAVFRVRTS